MKNRSHARLLFVSLCIPKAVHKADRLPEEVLKICDLRIITSLFLFEFGATT